MTAHKLVLSSSSEYFKMVFSNKKKYFQSQHALKCLVGLNQSDLNNVLDYIYHGEIQIYQQDLERFLGIAERLKVDCLIEGGDNHENEDDGKIEPIFDENDENTTKYRVAESSNPKRLHVFSKSVYVSS